MDERFYILPLDYDCFVVDSLGELKPFIISEVKYNDVIDWFEKQMAFLDNIELDKICLTEDETLFCANFECEKYKYGFSISALSKQHIYEIMDFLSIHNRS